jgi:hypothetical protein
MSNKITEIILDSGARVTIPEPFEYSKCKGCGADDIIWSLTSNNKNMPIRYDLEKKVWISHFADCPKANSFRKPIINLEK